MLQQSKCPGNHLQVSDCYLESNITYFTHLWFIYMYSIKAKCQSSFTVKVWWRAALQSWAAALWWGCWGYPGKSMCLHSYPVILMKKANENPWKWLRLCMINKYTSWFKWTCGLVAHSQVWGCTSSSDHLRFFSVEPDCRVSTCMSCCFKAASQYFNIHRKSFHAHSLEMTFI